MFRKESFEEATKLYDKFKIARGKGYTVFTKELYTPDIWKVLEDISDNFIKIDSYGIFEEAERRIIAFNNYEECFPLDLIKITVKNKFITLNHRDFLGSIMSLGINRNRIGDLTVKDNTCYLSAHREVTTYLLDNLIKIRNSNCELHIIENEKDYPKVSYDAKTINVNSLRLDAVVASIANVSRSEALILLKSGKVLLNYYVQNEKSKDISLKDKITIRGYGKFIVNEYLGSSKSGRLKIEILKYS
ncbi:YlmH/Sll1252 family protein [Clostridium cavendishii]|nr:YlmH/Sll1252 family protein [Clostridium cavendishii]